MVDIRVQQQQKMASNIAKIQSNHCLIFPLTMSEAFDCGCLAAECKEQLISGCHHFKNSRKSSVQPDDSMLTPPCSFKRYKSQLYTPIWNCFKYIINWEIEGILHARQHMRSKLFVTFYTSKIKFKLVIAPLVARVLKCLWVHIILSLIICRQASIIHYWAFDFLPGFNKSLQKMAVDFAF